mgnify:CR=1 FL=1
MEKYSVKKILEQELHFLEIQLSNIKSLRSYEYSPYQKNAITILRQRIKSVKRLLENIDK